MRTVRAIAVLLLVLAARPAAARRMPVLPELPADPEAYGRVVLDNSSSKAGVPVVTFDHWRHRVMFTCRVCHVDVGFAMAAGATQISAETNRSHLHCGACHDGKMLHDGKRVFAACSGSRTLEPGGACKRCHAGTDASGRQTYQAITGWLPRGSGRLAEWVDWDKAEEQGQLAPKDYIEGVSIRRPALKMDKDLAIDARQTWLGGVSFSHRKHLRWNGCEVCHPEIFPSTKQGAVRYDMQQIMAGKFCGACHVKVAFPIGACPGCHQSAFAR